MQSLTQAQQETFEKFKDCASELNDARELTAFTISFKLRDFIRKRIRKGKK